MRQRYLVALGSNQRQHRYGPPERVLGAALKVLNGQGLAVIATAPVLRSAAIGPSLRRYANSAAVIETRLMPDELLAVLKTTESAFGRRSGGQRWTARALDLDIVLWSGGAWSSSGLTVPHVAFRQRHFVLQPALAVAPEWRDPLTGRTVRQLAARLNRRRSAARRS